MYADIEALVLSGELFNGGERSSSPTRSIDPDEKDPGWHDDEYIAARQQEREAQGLDYDSDTARRDAAKATQLQEEKKESIGMTPGRTGVKGVIRDANEVRETEKEKRAQEAESMRRKMEAASLGGKTFLEEEREKAQRGEKADVLVEKELARAEERRGMFGRMREGRFGHLREVGMKGFLSAVEDEEPNTWVVVHLYHPSLERCYNIDATLSRLARTYPDTKFLRAKASTLGFAKLKPTGPKTNASRLRSLREEDEEDDPYAYDDKDRYDDEEDDEDDDDDNVDLDVLPTMLVYRHGDLVHNWVRVDWEAGDAGLEELLLKHHILPQSSAAKENLGLPSDDDDDFDLMFNDSDDDDFDL